MTESWIHELLKKTACGCNEVRTEFRLPDGKRIDCRNDMTHLCVEIQRSRDRLPYDIEKLSKATSQGYCERPTIYVPKRDHEYARQLAKTSTVRVDVKSIPETVLDAVLDLPLCPRLPPSTSGTESRREGRA